MSLDGGIDFPSSSSAGSDNLGSLISQSLSDGSKERIASIANDVKQLTDVEKLLLYLQLPTSNSGSDQHKTKGIGVVKKADVEMSQTYAWIQTHLEEDPTVSLPKQEVYEDYRLFCIASKFEPMCVADFGKAMKHIFPTVKPRRLGQRGNSKYCYSGLKKKVRVDTPELPLIDQRKALNVQHVKSNIGNEDDMFVRIVLTWAEKLTENRFMSISDLAAFLVSTQRIDPDDFKLDPSWIKSCKKVCLPSREPSRKKRSASSSSCPRVSDMKQNVFTSSMPMDKVPIPRLRTKVQFPVPPPPATGPFKKIRPRIEPPSTDESLISSDSFENMNGSSLRRQSLSAPSTLVSSPQLDIQSNKFYECVDHTDSRISGIEYPNMKLEEDSSMFSQQSTHQSNDHLVQGISGDDEPQYGDFLADESFNGGNIVQEDCSDPQISQLRKLLEKNLPQKVDTFDSLTAPLQGFSDLRENLQRKSVATALQHFEQSCPVTMAQKFDPSNDGTVTVNEEQQQATVSYYNRETQYPSVPVSPNLRRNDFTFQPIPSSLDIIAFQDKPVENNMESSLLNGEAVNSPVYQLNQQSVAVGTASDPPSGTNSPFLSPRETPTPANRSRNDSGQSSYMRQTPYTVGDSGVSSIASSPFISPQTTPIPQRIRTGSGHMTRSNQSLRSRHSSGPGIPSFVRNMSIDSIGQYQAGQNERVFGTQFGDANGWERGVDSSRMCKMLNLGRHRHLSSPYSLNNQYVVEEMKNYFRSQSVPAAREGFGEQHLKSVPENYSLSKNDDFDQSSPPDETGSLMRRDVMVSGMGTNNGWNHHDPQGRARNITGSLDITPESDELQTTIEDLRDFDNDYSNFEQLIALSEPVAVSSDLV